MAKAAVDDFYTRLVNDATLVDRDETGAVTQVEVPPSIADQVAEVASSGKALTWPITDEAEFERIRTLYVSAARAIGKSATVTRIYTKVKDDAGNQISRDWTGTRVSIGVKRGRPLGRHSSNGDAPVETPADHQEHTISGW